MDDNKFNSNKIKLTPHMFQKSRQDPIDIEINQENLAKIMKSYSSNLEEQINENFYIESLKGLVKLQDIDETEEFEQYLTELKSKFIKEKELKEKEIDLGIPETIDNSEIVLAEDEEEDTMIFETKQDDSHNEEVDIGKIIKSSEMEIINTKDQKTLLKSLIDDVTLNSTNNIQYDDTQFERNMLEIINDEISLEDDYDIAEDNNNDHFTDKRGKNSYLILIMVIIILLIVAGYLNREAIFELFG